MTIDSLSELLRGSGITNGTGEALMIVSGVTGLPQSYLLCERKTDLSSVRGITDDGVRRISECAAKRAQGYPLQYLLGRWDFMDSTFITDERALIPRQETELLCQHAMELIGEGMRYIDLCTGSGCVAVSVKKRFPDLDTTAVDISRDALALAMENEESILGRKTIKFIEADITDGDARRDIFAGQVYDVITANPPYVTEDEMKEVQRELRYEPRIALTDGGDGMSVIGAAVSFSKEHLAEGGTVLIEHGCSQGEKVRELLTSQGFRAETSRDLSGLDRLTTGRKI